MGSPRRRRDPETGDVYNDDSIRDKLKGMKPEAKAKVCEQRCKTCVFDKQNRFIDTERFRELAKEWKNGQSHQICHQFGVGVMDDNEDGEFEHVLDGEDVWCRGFFDTLPQWQQRLFELMGWIEFVPLPGE